MEKKKTILKRHSPSVNIDEVKVLLNLHIESIAFQFNNKFLKLIQSEFSHSESHTFLDEKRKSESLKSEAVKHNEHMNCRNLSQLLMFLPQRIP